jgi:hypothetical protein
MNRKKEALENNYILERIWRKICSYCGREEGGRDDGEPRICGLSESPPQVVENRKIIIVSV